ncbi:GNAT family N-acetyltransferase [Actinotalea sp. Marseille-Q4924]|uniref:GNAT family N-acetyltransferase n=1 Tax=Actinotalea sp. Marseille-Q4924 TaxID=2866571 RepID=UPI001CE482F2|nr:GNAT family N-acetyltransferase [Actinotalea sp. Marseille-Q4924]
MTRWGAGLGGTRSDLGAATDVDLHEALRVCDRDPVASVLAASRVEATLAEGGRRAGTALWGFRRDGRLDAVCWAGANLVPVCRGDDDEALDAFARTALRQGRRCSSIVGDAGAVLGLWRRLEPSWGPAREVRADQPSLVIDHEPLVDADPAVRLARPDEIGSVLPACVHMFLEEVGYSPVEGGGTAYESRVRALIAGQRSYVRMERGPDGPQVVFKAELGAVTREVAQVQGVWVTPSRRGQGLSAPGMAAVVRLARARVAPLVSLYVNHYNERALASYERVGFHRVGTYATVLF